MSLFELAFSQWPKTPRLFRDMVITEKIDGTNAAIGIVEMTEAEYIGAELRPSGITAQVATAEGKFFGLYAQSRKRLITPADDNFGFATWVEGNGYDLIIDLGPGLHFGEWWGSGIQRGYGLPKGEKRFSLFNTARYGGHEFVTPNVATVPVLRQHTFSTDVIRHTLEHLKEQGSHANPGFPHPEGIVIYHTAAGQMFKVTIEGDDSPKGAA